jgi:hypothetical protein
MTKNKYHIEDSLIRFIFPAILFVYWIGGVLRFRYAEAVLILLCFILSCTYILTNAKKVKISLKVLSIALAWVVLTTWPFSFRGDLYLPSIFYEIYKLSVFTFLVPIYLYTTRHGTSYINKCVAVFILANFFVLILQHTFGVGITRFLGISYDTSFYESRGRPTGLTFNANIIGVIGLFAFIFYDIAKTKGGRLMKSLSFGVVVLSTSKASLICLFFYLITRVIKVKKILKYGVFVSVLFFILYSLDFYGISLKIEKYILFISGILNNSTIAQGDIEGRLWGWYVALKLMADNFLGYGLGTWGDFSSSFNPYVHDNPLYIDTSDSGMSHILVEQGIFSTLYFYLIYIFLPQSPQKLSVFSLLIFLYITNFGFSQSLFYMGLWLYYLAVKGNQYNDQKSIYSRDRS